MNTHKTYDHLPPYVLIVSEIFPGLFYIQPGLLHLGRRSVRTETLEPKTYASSLEDNYCPVSNLCPSLRKGGVRGGMVSLVGNRQLQGNCGMGESLLDTCLRTVSTEKVIYTPATDINHHQKHANIEAMNYFLTTKQKQITKQLANQCLCEWYNLDIGSSFDIKELPLDLADIFNLRLTTYRNQCLLNFAEYQFTNYIESTKRSLAFRDYAFLDHQIELLHNAGLK